MEVSRESVLILGTLVLFAPSAGLWALIPYVLLIMSLAWDAFAEEATKR